MQRLKLALSCALLAALTGVPVQAILLLRAATVATCALPGAVRATRTDLVGQVAAARKDLAGHGLSNLVVWALADNERAIAFYERLGGRLVREAQERFGPEMRTRVAFAFE